MPRRLPIALVLCLLAACGTPTPESAIHTLEHEPDYETCESLLKRVRSTEASTPAVAQAAVARLGRLVGELRQEGESYETSNGTFGFALWAVGMAEDHAAHLDKEDIDHLATVADFEPASSSTGYRYIQAQAAAVCYGWMADEAQRTLDEVRERHPWLATETETDTEQDAASIDQAADGDTPPAAPVEPEQPDATAPMEPAR